ncbi:MFS transporter [Janibacter melonis]|uniref:MFS transporter n=1 Tax=Janibacter melonis TaxID=262209 RepID=UPI00174CA376|nr:MFS transporter [Janibacter melonis]
MILLTMPAIIFTTITYEMLPVGVLSPMATGLGTQVGDAGLIMTSYAVVVVLGSIPASAALARFQPKKVLLALTFTFIVSTSLLAAAPNLGVAIAARIIGGAAHGAIFTAALRVAFAVIPRSKQPLAVSVVSAGNSLALAFGVPAGSLIVGRAPWQVPFLVVAAAFFVLSIIVALTVPSRDADETAATQMGVKDALKTFANRDTLLLAATIIVITLAHYTTYTYVEPILRDMGVSEVQVGLTLMGYGLASAAGLVAFSRASARRPQVSLRVLLIAMSTVLVLIALALSSQALITAALLMWGFFFGAVPVIFQFLALTATGAVETAPALVNTSFNVGIASGSVVGGLILSSFGTGSLPWASALILALLVVAMAARTVAARRAAGPGTKANSNPRNQPVTD